MGSCVRRPKVDGGYGRPISLDPELGRVIDRHREEWFAVHAGAPGVEVYRDSDLTWKIENGSVWANAGTALRFSARNVDRRLDSVLARFAKHGRGAGFWIDIDATPSDLEDRLKRRGFRCRKHFPGMSCDLTKLPKIAVPQGIIINRTTDYSIYSQYPHPVLGSITTAIRRHQLKRLQHLTSTLPLQVFDFVALEDEKRPVGGCTLFLSKWAAGIHDVGVLETERGKGIGSALVSQVLEFARSYDKSHAVLLSTGMGFTMYQRLGFREVCRIGYWYKASVAQ